MARQETAARERLPLGEAGVTVEEAGHWPFIDEPRATLDLVVSFLRRQLNG